MFTTLLLVAAALAVGYFLGYNRRVGQANAIIEKIEDTKK
jgi:hypothetical protein